MMYTTLHGRHNKPPYEGPHSVEAVLCAIYIYISPSWITDVFSYDWQGHADTGHSVDIFYY